MPLRYSEADQVSLASLESVALPAPERPGDAWVLRDVTFQAPAGKLTASATEKELTEACEAARIWELILSLPDGLDTIRGTGATVFPVGRNSAWPWPGCCSRPLSVVVLDEATAHLDSESEMAIQRALATALSGRTSLVIAHRLSTVRAADQILVIDGGQIAERGTHDGRAARRGRGVRGAVPDTVRAPGSVTAVPGGSLCTISRAAPRDG